MRGITITEERFDRVRTLSKSYPYPTQKMIGTLVGLSQSTVSRILLSGSYGEYARKEKPSQEPSVLEAFAKLADAMNKLAAAYEEIADIKRRELTPKRIGVDLVEEQEDVPKKRRMPWGK